MHGLYSLYNPTKADGFSLHIPSACLALNKLKLWKYRKLSLAGSLTGSGIYRLYKTISGPPRGAPPKNVSPDELPKPRPSQQKPASTIAGSCLSAFRLPQELGGGQSVEGCGCPAMAGRKPKRKLAVFVQKVERYILGVARAQRDSRTDDVQSCLPLKQTLCTTDRSVGFCPKQSSLIRCHMRLKTTKKFPQCVLLFPLPYKHIRQ